MKAILLVFLIAVVPGALLAQPLWTPEGTSGGTGVAINQLQLEKLLDKSNGQFSLPVQGQEYRVDVEQVSQPNLGVTSLRGSFAGKKESFFLLCRTEGGAVVAFFQPGDGSAYRLDQTGGQLAVREVDYENMGGCGGALTPESVGGGSPVDHSHSAPLKPENPAPNKSRAMADDGSRHDILVAYTTAAEEAMGGWDNIRAEAQLAIDAANLAYLNSNITSSLRLVHVMGTDYTEISAWDYEDHLIYLWDPDDGHMDPVLEMRDSVGADFVSVLIDGRDFQGEVPICGIAPVMQSDMINGDFEEYALSVVSVSCAATNWSLVHEVGHNRGCAHNRENAGIDGAYSYSYGRRVEGASNQDYRTVMAYDLDEGYPRVPYFTNPDVDYNGVPTGVPIGWAEEAHNARTHDNTAALSATWRAERTFVQFGWGEFSNGLILFPFPTLAQAAASARDHGAIVLLNDNPTFTGTLAGPFEYIYEGSGSGVLGGN